MNEIKIIGEVRSLQTDLKTGRVIPGTFKKWSLNTVADNLKYYLAKIIASNATDRALDSLFDDDGTQASVGAAQDGNDGIAHGEEGIDYILNTTLNTGGTEAEAYVEFYGYIDGAATFDGYLYLGSNYINSSKTFTTIFASTFVTETIASGRRYHHYWKFTLS